MYTDTLVSWHPTTSLANDRYDKTDLADPTHLTIPVGSYQDQGCGPNLPCGWTSHVHPEGKRYFCRNHGLRVVTEAWMHRQSLAERVQFAAKTMEDALSQQKPVLPKDPELFIQLDENSGSFSYYFIDHSSRTQFWIESIPSESLDLPPAETFSHLKLALEEHYWNHVSNFPMHFGGISAQTVDELLGVFSHGRADRITSQVSTFPYDADQCAKILELLRNSRGDIANGYTTCYVARLWSVIASNRFKTHYGQEHPRLSRDQAILVPHRQQQHWLFNIAFKLALGIPDYYFTRFGDIYVDELVYADQWHAFMSDCQNDWKMSLSWVLPLLLANIMMSLISKAFPTVTAVTALVCSMSALASMLLLTRHQELLSCSASNAVRYLGTIQSDTFGFQHMAFIFSLPKALCLWSFVLLISHWILIVARMVHITTAIGPVLVVLALVLCVRRGVAPDTEDSTCSDRPISIWDRVWSQFLSRESDSPECFV